MKIRAVLAGVALALSVSSMSSGASAASLFTLTGPTVHKASPDFIDVTFDAGAGPGSLTFILDGFATIDGQGVTNAVGSLTDVFTLSLNGADILSGAFDLGGGGTNVVFFKPAGATITPQRVPGGGTVNISTAISLIAGQNTLRFAYASVIPQGINDEAWAIQAVSALGEAAVGSAPEPTTWALLLAGFFGLGAALRRQRRKGLA